MSKRAVLVVVAAAAVIVLAAGGAYAMFFRAETFTVRGSVAVEDADGGGWVSETGPCQLSGGYADLRPGGQVTIADASGRTLAVGELFDGQLAGSTTCELPFTVTDVPAGEDFYKLEVTHRGALTKTEDELRAGPALAIG